MRRMGKKKKDFQLILKEMLLPRQTTQRLIYFINAAKECSTYPRVINFSVTHLSNSTISYIHQINKFIFINYVKKCTIVYEIIF